MVTFKKFGRKYTVPPELAPQTPTRAQRKRSAATQRFFTRARTLQAAEPKLPSQNARFAFATQGVVVAREQAAR